MSVILSENTILNPHFIKEARITLRKDDIVHQDEKFKVVCSLSALAETQLINEAQILAICSFNIQFLECFKKRNDVVISSSKN